jgi:hypothetical protein
LVINGGQRHHVPACTLPRIKGVRVVWFFTFALPESPDLRIGAFLLLNQCHRTTGLLFFIADNRSANAPATSNGDGRFAKLIQQLAKTDLLILDDWGLGTGTNDP